MQPNRYLEFVVASGKGGVGKSTVSSTLILYLHRRHGNVIALDADADAPNLHLIFNVAKWDFEKPYVASKTAYIVEEKCVDCGLCADVCVFNAIKEINGHYVIDEVLCEGCATCAYVCPTRAIRLRTSESGKVRMVKTKYGFTLISAELNVGKPNTGKLVTEEKELARKIAQNNSLVIVDSAAGIGCQVIASIAGSNLAILVVEPTPASFSDFKRVHKLAVHFRIPSVLIINKYDINEGFLRKIEEYASSENIEMLGYIPYDDVVPKSMTMLKPLIEAFPNSKASKALLNIAKGVEEIYVNWDSWKTKHMPKRYAPYRPKIIKPPKIY